MAPLDLLSWPDLQDAEHRAEQARREWHHAQRRFRYAPHGERQNREAALRTASERVLRADLALAQLQSEAEA